MTEKELEKAIEFIEKALIERYGYRQYEDDYQVSTQKLLQKLRSGELVEVVLGEWKRVYNQYKELTGFIHVECGYNDYCARNFCPNCGAKMDGRKENG